MHDLHSNEANAADGVWLTPDGMENIVSVKLQQHAMQCDPLEDEIRLVCYAPLFCMFRKFVVPGPNLFCFSCQNPSKFLNLTFRNDQGASVKTRSRLKQLVMAVFMLLFHGKYNIW